MSNKNIGIIHSSLHLHNNNLYFIVKIKNTRCLGILYKNDKPKDFKGYELNFNNWNLLLCPLSDKNADAIRKIFPQHSPSVIKKNKFIFGFGYRSYYLIGNIIQAKIVKKYKDVIPILAQQSVRELQKTGRSFKDVLNSATWSTFEANINYWGADADHLKEPQQVKEPARLGFTHFTIDPSDKLIIVNKNKIEREFLKFPEKERERILKTYLGNPFKIEVDYNFTEEKIKEITVKYKNLFKLLEDFIRVIKKETTKDVGIELSVDETEDITSPEEIIYILEELKRKKLKIDTIAPKFFGNFEKGVDYFSEIRNGKKIRNTKLFEKHFASLYKIAKYYSVKLCLHSGSDKFSVYPIIKKITDSDVHIKTAGTFFLEELKLLSKQRVDDFKKIFNFAKNIFEKERASYKLSTQKDKLPNIDRLDGEKIYELLDTKCGSDELRQVMHVSYGKILTHPEFKKILEEVVSSNENKLYKIFLIHIKKHLQFFNK